MQRQCLIKLLFKFVISMLGWTTACRTRGQSSDEQDEQDARLPESLLMEYI